jgi:hypothetical protein
MTPLLRRSIGAVLLSGLLVPASSSVWRGGSARAQAQSGSRALADALAPRFELDPSWPKPLADGAAWPELTRAATAVAADSRDHVWIFQVLSPGAREAEAAGATVPRLFEFDTAGNLVQGWGGPGRGYQWMEALVPNPIWPAGTPPEHGMFIDHKDNV